MSTVVVRADASDVDALTPLFAAYRVFYGQPDDVEAARTFCAARLVDGEGSVFFLASRDRKFVGFARMWATYSSIAVSQAWILEDLYVVPSARKSGVAKALMDRAARHARALGAVSMSLETAHDNRAAQALYESLGYQREGAFYKYNLAL